MSLFNNFKKQLQKTTGNLGKKSETPQKNPEKPQIGYAEKLTLDLHDIRLDKLIEFEISQKDDQICIKLTINCGGQDYTYTENITVNNDLTEDENLINIQDYIRILIWNCAGDVIQRRDITIPRSLDRMRIDELLKILKDQPNIDEQ